MEMAGSQSEVTNIARKALEVGRSGAERYKATCHPRLGGACEAIGLVRVAQAGVAGAAPSRDGKTRSTAGRDYQLRVRDSSGLTRM